MSQPLGRTWAATNQTITPPYLLPSITLRASSNRNPYPLSYNLSELYIKFFLWDFNLPLSKRFNFNLERIQDVTNDIRECHPPRYADHRSRESKFVKLPKPLAFTWEVKSMPLLEGQLAYCLVQLAQRKMSTS